MMNFFRKHKVTIILVILVGFFGGTFIAGFGVSTFGNASSLDTVAVVNGKKIPYKYYYSLYNNALGMLRNSDQDATQETLNEIKSGILRTLIQEELIWQQTKDYGVIVSDNELVVDIQTYPLFLDENNHFNSKSYYKFLNTLRLSPKDFETLRRKQLASEKLQILIASAAKISNSEVTKQEDKDAALQVKANQVLNDWFDNIKRNSKIKVLLEDKD